MIQNTPDRFASLQQSFADQASTASARMREYIEDNPSNSVLIGLGVGFGVGLLLGSMLSGSSSYFSREEEESFAERIGHKVADSISGVLPSSWKNSLPF